MRKYLQRWFVKFIVKDVFHTISKEDIFKMGKNGEWTFKGKEMDPDIRARIQTQAANFKDSTLWQILKAELQWSAAKSLLEGGRSETDIRVAQIQGYLTRVIDEKLVDLSK